jgi:hypothetical protein
MAEKIGAIGLDSEGQPAVSEPILFSLGDYNGHHYLDIRKQYKDSGSGELKPGRKGITVRGRQLDEVIKILTENRDKILAWDPPESK